MDDHWTLRPDLFYDFRGQIKKKITNLKPKEKLLIFNYTYNTYIFH